MSRNTGAVMQIFPGPYFLAKPSLRLLAQSPQPAPSAIGAILMCGQRCQILTHNTVDRGIMICGIASNGSQNFLVHNQGNILHEHSICGTL